MVQEARVCEMLMKYPRENVARYYGYVEKDGLMVGMCFKRYGQTLSDAIRTGLIRREGIEPSLDQIKKGIEHIHGLGLVHVNSSHEHHDDRHMSDFRVERHQSQEYPTRCGW